MKWEENQNTKTYFKKEGVVNPTNAELNKMIRPVSPELTGWRLLLIKSIAVQMD